jgi:hypothetical protein
MAPLAPSSESATYTGGWPAGLEDRKPDLGESEVGRPNFSVAITQVDSMDWVWLHYQGQRRERFDYKADGGYDAVFLTP